MVDVLTMRLGSGRLVLAAHLNFGRRLSFDQFEELSTRIEQQLRIRYPQVQQVFLGPTWAPGPPPSAEA